MPERNDRVYEFKHPVVARELMIALSLLQKARWSDLVDDVKGRVSKSRSTIGQVLSQLVSEGLVLRDEKSDRNVQYELSRDGWTVLREAREKSKKTLFELLIDKEREPVDVGVELIVSWVFSHYLKEVPDDVRMAYENIAREYFRTEVQNTAEALGKLFSETWIHTSKK